MPIPRPSFLRFHRLLVFPPLFFLAFGLATARAQVQVEVSLSRHSYILYEPIIATVIVNNYAGRDLEFRDVPGKQWFNVEMTTGGEQQIPPYDPNYQLSPLTVPTGKSVKRQIDLTPLFPVRDMGPHRIRANVYLADADRFFYSGNASFELTDGHVLWQQTVGNSQGEVRQMTLLTHHLIDRVMLYARVRDADGPNVYTTQSLGRVLTAGELPQTLLDRANTLHVMHEAVPRGYYYTRISTDGTRLGQVVYTSEGQDRPRLIKLPSGVVEVRGGHLQAGVAKAGQAVTPNRDLTAPGMPKLSDRPSGMPPVPRQVP